MSWRSRGLLFRKCVSSSSSPFSLPNILPQSLSLPAHPRLREEEEEEAGEEDRWSKLLPELLGDIVRRVDEAGERWPARKDVVSCACVCRRWREAALGVVRPPRASGNITFPSSLKQPGPKDRPLQCFIRRSKKSGTFYLYLGLADTFIDQGKFLMAARKVRHGTYTEYIISLAADDLSQGSNAYLGKLRSDFLGTNFTIYDTQAPFLGAKQSSCRASRRFTSKQISPQVPARSFIVGQVSYKFNLLKSKGPRRMVCTLQCPWMKQAPDEEGDSPKNSNSLCVSMANQSIILKNKAPRWHEHLQCWCLNFHGRVTVASVKNFQLAAAMDPSKPERRGDEDTVLLQFGKIGDDMFTMDYRQPLSAFQAFAICLTSFGTKLACE